jgi:hypothetical protein
MKIDAQKLQEDLIEDVYWGRIYFTSDDGFKKSKILLYISNEYFQQFFNKANLQDINFDPWIKEVIKKWTKLKDDIFNQDVHYDIYVTTQEGEAKGLDFLLEKAKS